MLKKKLMKLLDAITLSSLRTCSYYYMYQPKLPDALKKVETKEKQHD